MNRCFDKEKKAAIRAVTIASRLCTKVRSVLVEGSTMVKKDRSPVTIADYGSQAVICRVLRDTFPNDPIVAEEDSRELNKAENQSILEEVVRRVQDAFPDASPRQVCCWIDWGREENAERFWTLDPIDGTKGFLRGDQYAIALALIEGGVVQLGVLGCPNLPLGIHSSQEAGGALFVAIKGRGTVQSDLDALRQVPIRVSAIATPAQARVTESFESGHSDHISHEEIARYLNVSAPPLRMDSQAKYAVLARGEASIYLRLPSPETPDYREKIWDHAAGSIVIEEAGGRVTDAFGKTLDFSQGRRLEGNRGIVATNGQLHDAVLEAVAVELGTEMQDRGTRKKDQG